MLRAGVSITAFAQARTSPAGKPVSKRPALEFVALADGGGAADSSGKEWTHQELRDVDKKRKALLNLARSTSAMDTLFKFWTLPRTVLPRLAVKPLIYVILASFTCGAVLARFGIMSDDDVAEAEQLEDAGGTMVTFIVVFYVGYCYTRYNQQFDDVQDIMHSINDACIDARVAFGDPEEVHRFWRYINLLHIAAYCGLTAELSESNFFMPIVEKYGLLGEGKVRAEEEAVIKRIGLDENGSRACSMFEVWVMEIVKGEAKRARLEDPRDSNYDLTPPIQARLHLVLSQIGVSIKRLFSYRYQVMPFIYTHLVSLSCFVYRTLVHSNSAHHAPHPSVDPRVCVPRAAVFAEAFISGVRFKPSASVSFGLIFPLIFVLAKIISTFGLIVVGETILDPFGTDPEDFALLHFIEVTVTSSHEAIEIEASLKRAKDRQDDFYDPEELAAAKKLVRRMVKRYRLRKLISRAQARNKDHGIAQGKGQGVMAPLATSSLAIADGTLRRPVTRSLVSTPEEPRAVEAQHVENKCMTMSFIPVGKGLNAAKLIEVAVPSHLAASDGYTVRPLRDPAQIASIAGVSLKPKQRSPSSRPGSRAKKNVLRAGSCAGLQPGREHPGRSFGAVGSALSTPDELVTMPSASLVVSAAPTAMISPPITSLDA